MHGLMNIKLFVKCLLRNRGIEWNNIYFLPIEILDEKIQSDEPVFFKEVGNTKKS